MKPLRRHVARLALIVWITGVIACDGGPDGLRPTASAPPVYTVDTVTVAPSKLTETLTATGTLLPRESVELQSERAGVVREIAFVEGRPVKAGTVLVRIDDSELRAELERAKARLALDTASEQRQRALLESSGTSRATYDTSVASLRTARAEANLIEAQIAKTAIRAPFDGVPGLRHVSVGSYVTPGTRIVSFTDTAALKLDFGIPERYAAYVEAGQDVTFRIVGRSESFQARIYAIEPAVEVATRSILLRAEVPNPEDRLRPGAFAEVKVVLADIPDAIAIPAMALVPGLRQQSVFVFENGKAESRSVQIGLRTPDAVQIIEGLAPGDRVITTGILQLRSGMRVEARDAGSVVEDDGVAKAASN